MKIEIAQTWEREPAEAGERVRLDVVLGAGELRVAVDAPYHGDPAPAAEPGACDGLWQYEVVELFLLGSRQRYLEIELGPHGHYWVLQLEGVRKVRSLAQPIAYESRISGARWAAEARFARALLPDPLTGANAYAIHGQGGTRRHLAWQAVPGDRPDFHRLQYFAAISIEQLSR